MEGEEVDNLDPEPEVKMFEEFFILGPDLSELDPNAINDYGK
jgi:hypothetical protein